ASFFALGIARAIDAPVALLCTSGTAAANFFPAIVEARAASVPLLVLTADRPPELRDVGAAQTIDQNRLYGNYPKWFAEVAFADSAPEMLRYVRTLACRAIAGAAATPPGPVHLNFPFREPLTPVPVDALPDNSDADTLAWQGRANGAPWVAVHDRPPVCTTSTTREIAALLRESRSPLLVCGPQYDPMLAAPLAALAATLDAPLLVDPLSQLRWGPHDHCALIDRYDAVLRDSTATSHLVPDVVLRIGAIPTSKPLLQYLERSTTAQQIVVDAAHWPDPTLLAGHVVHSDPRRFCEDLLAQLPSASAVGPDHAAWLARWRRIDARAGEALATYVADLDENFEGAALAAVAAIMPDRGTIFVSSSMPVRDLDAFARGDTRALRVLANRGANGIDGVVSSALGVAATLHGADGPLVLVIGDIAMYHDMNGLLAAKLHDLDATIVLLNNDGGGIFSFLPQTSEPAHFEQLFGTPHGLRFESAAKLYGARYQHVDSIRSLRDAVTDGINGHGLHIVELDTNRVANVRLHRDAWAQVANAVARAVATAE
ncbi:MAG TPA: 2-succinyl-5-enolpyruvyl-6-hydroxy-3-cyclohexene-1-carboxylic-acid synthase, partial [Gemmatimonadaceae bacterium]